MNVGLRPCNSFSGNTGFEFSVLVLCSAKNQSRGLALGIGTGSCCLLETHHAAPAISQHPSYLSLIQSSLRVGGMFIFRHLLSPAKKREGGP